MDKGDGFWSSHISNTKGWRTRRDQQDAYRRALDEQIEQRKLLDARRVRKYTESSVTTPQVNDPIRHLMPWLNHNDAHKQSQSNNPISTGSSQIQASQPHPPQQMQNPQQLYGSPQQHVPVPNYYFVAPTTAQHGQILPPTQYDNQSQLNLLNTPATSQTLPIPFSNPQQIQQQQPNNIAYGFYGSTPIPPPAAFMHPHPQQSSYTQQAYSYPPYNHQPTMSQMPTPENQEKSFDNHAGEKQQTAFNNRTEDPNTNNSNFGSNSGENSEFSKKPHVSQTSEEAPDLSKVKCHYRNDLQKQMEERRKQEEYRQAQEKLEEERLQKKVQEDHERMRREYEEDERRKRAKEEEKRKQEAENIRRTKEALEDEALRRKLQREEQRLKKIEEEKRKIELPKTPIYRPLPQNSFDSTPLPTLAEKEVRKETTTVNGMIPKRSVQHSTREMGDNDNSGSLNIFGQSHISDPQQRQNSAGPGASKSSQEFHYYDSKQTGTDDIVCPKCSKSFSATDLHIPKSPEEQQKVLRFLHTFRTILEAEKNDNGSEWNEE